MHRQNASRELYELSFFLTYYTAEDLVYFSFLKGLLEYRGDGSKRALRMLYSPWPIEWESPAVRDGTLAIRFEEDLKKGHGSREGFLDRWRKNRE